MDRNAWLAESRRSDSGSLSPKIGVLLCQIAWDDGDVVRSNAVWASIGLGYIHAQLSDLGFPVTSFILSPDSSGFRDLRRELHQLKPAIVGLGATGNELNAVHTVATRIKSEAPDAIIIVGGYASMRPEALLSCMSVDAVAVGEGEETMSELARCIDRQVSWQRVPGIVFRGNDGTMRKTAPRHAIADLDSLPLPEYGHVPSDSSIIRVYASRGCPFECSFCKIKDFYSSAKIRCHSPGYMSRLLQKLLAGHSGNVEIVYFNDDEFLLDRRHFTGMAGVIRDLGLKMVFQTRSADILKHSSVLLENADVVHQVHLGIESFSQSQLDRWRKNCDVSTNVRALELLSENQIAFYPYILLSDADTTPLEIRDTCSGILQMPRSIVQPFDSVDPHPVCLSPVESGLFLNRMKGFDGAMIRNDKSSWLEEVWTYINATESSYRQLTKILQRVAKSRNGSRKSRMSEVREMAWERFEVVPEIATSSSCGKENATPRSAISRALDFRERADDLIFQFACDSLQVHEEAVRGAKDAVV